MPSHRQPDSQYAAEARRPIPPDQLCRVIPVGTELPCDRRGYKTHPRRLCKEHQSEYKALYLAYKNSSDEVDRFKALVDDEPNWEDPTRLTLAAVQTAITNRQSFMDAIQEEIRGREKYQARFIAEPDDGHIKRLRLRRRMRQECSRVSEQLRRRQAILLAQVREEQRRKQEAANAAELRRQEDIRMVADCLRRCEERRQENMRKQEQEQRREDVRRMRQAQVEATAKSRTRIQDERDALLANGRVVDVQGSRVAHQGSQPSIFQQAEHRSLAGHTTIHASQPRLHHPPGPASISRLDDLEGQREAEEGVGESRGRVECGVFILMTLVILVLLVYWVR